MPGSILISLVVSSTLTSSTPVGEPKIVDRGSFSVGSEVRQSDFVAMDLRQDIKCELQGSRLEERHPPWSTFKIPNFLIALDTGAAQDVDHWRPWNPELRPAANYWPDAWKQAQTLETAFRQSAAWYFQDIAAIVGGQRYRDVLSDWSYGNAAAPDGDDAFWLNGELAISPEEQLIFLQRLIEGELDLDGQSLEALARASIDGTADGLTLHGKTGSGPVSPGDFPGEFEGWYVGWVSSAGTPSAVYAHYMRAERFADLSDLRRSNAILYLEACGLLEPGVLQ